MQTFHILNENHQNISANALIVIYIGKETGDFSNLKLVFDQINQSFYSSDLLENTEDFKATQDIDGKDVEFFHFKLKFKDRMDEKEFNSVCDIIKSILNNFSDIIFKASLEKRQYNSFSFVKGNLNYEEKVLYNGKIYDFGYYSKTPGKAIIYKQGERNMQDSVTVSIKDLERI